MDYPLRELYHVFFNAHVSVGNILALAGSYPHSVDKVAPLRNNTFPWRLFQTHLGLNYPIASAPGAKYS